MKEWLPPRSMANAGQLHMLYTCPFCWKVRGLLEHLDIPHERIQVNPMRTKKTLPSAPEWNKVPVWVDSNNEVHVDSTPIMKHIDSIHNGGKLWSSDDEERRDKWMDWVDLHMSKATFQFCMEVLARAENNHSSFKLEKFGFFSKRLYAWAGFPVMWESLPKASQERRQNSQKIVA